MVRVTAKDRIPYADKVYNAGETFEVSDEDAKILVGSETVTLAPAEEPQKAPRRSKREYARRDLLAEGSEQN